MFNLKPNESKANNIKKIIHYLDKQNIVLHQTPCEEKQCLGSTKVVFQFYFSFLMKKIAHKAVGLQRAFLAEKNRGFFLVSLAGELCRLPDWAHYECWMAETLSQNGAERLQLCRSLTNTGTSDGDWCQFSLLSSATNKDFLCSQWSRGEIFPVKIYFIPGQTPKGDWIPHGYPFLYLLCEVMEHILWVGRNAQDESHCYALFLMPGKFCARYFSSLFLSKNEHH